MRRPARRLRDLQHATAPAPPEGTVQGQPEGGRHSPEPATASWALADSSGQRFAEHRWRDAAALAREALALDPRDAYALDVLGSSLFMLDDEVGALRAWNQIGKPRVNRVRIDGLHHTRYQTLADIIGIQPNTLLTAERFERARRRLKDLPDQVIARLAVRPESDGFATIDVVVAELSPLPRGAVEWMDSEDLEVHVFLFAT